ncbi:hypothetical protein HYC85_015236, partial [Camellia sinensis]
LQGRIGESSFSLKISTELLEVLNRIWSLKEQHAFNTSLVNALKRELDHSRAQIKELLREKETHRQEEQGGKSIKSCSSFGEGGDRRRAKIKRAFRNPSQKLAPELSELKTSFSNATKIKRAFRNPSQKLALELSELKTSFSDATKELEKEKKE